VLSIIFNKEGFTGRVIDETEYSKIELNLSFNNNSDYELYLDNNITALLLTGKIIGDGSVKVYMDNLLILDSTGLEENGMSAITGQVIEENATDNNSDISEQVPDIDSTNASIPYEANTSKEKTLEENNSRDDIAKETHESSWQKMLRGNTLVWNIISDNIIENNSQDILVNESEDINYTIYENALAYENILTRVWD